MWRYLAGAVGALLLAGAGVFLFRGTAAPEAKAPPQPLAAVQEPLPEEAPSAPERSREQKRFDRVDRDKDGTITREEFLALRRRAYAKLDTNGDGKLSFDEWAIRTTKRFAGADKDRSSTLTRAEFATTAVRRKPAAPKCACAPAKAGPAAKAPPPAAAAEEEGEGEE
ncbi:EF-hand domain-containing protein [Sphingomonas canadensis]|uniref:EF-hand domain-containing protein n=1 Tax=Sphingomonas canadensis TaxID=1219257 RepID=A0ABW3H699_9SPHN|nr:EF-hand domain-containing protein [Sphingomonas canadensis]MCW3836865.1 EF-hand domain-containing protein [Sphingomonas canadensis]